MTKEEKREYQRQWLAARRLKGIQYLGGKCSKCESVEELEFDHIDPTTKELFGNTRSIKLSYSWARVIEELDKCQLLCKTCHYGKTREQFVKFVHGTDTMYENHGCRCDECKAYKRKRNAKRYASLT